MSDPLPTLPAGLAELAHELEQTWPDHLAALRAADVPLMEGGDPADPDAGDPDPVPDPVPDVPSAEGDPAPDPAPGIDWNDLPPEAEARMGRLLDDRLAAILAEAAPRPAPEDLSQIDLFADNGVQDLLGAFGRLLDQRLAGVEGFVQSQAGERIDQQITSQVQTAVADAKLDNAPDDSVIASFAEAFTGQAVQQYGRTPYAATAAIKSAVQWLADRDKASEARGVAAYRKSIGEIADTPAEPSGRGGGLQIEPKATSYDEIIARHEARLAAA